MGKTLRFAIFSLGAYGAILILNAAFYKWWSGELAEPSRLAIRLIGVSLIAWGLWRRDKWAWWFGLIFSGLFAALGAVGLFFLVNQGILANRPYPVIDIAFLALMILTLIGTFVCLLLPQTRDVVKDARQTT